MNDRQQRGFVVLLQEAHVQSGLAAERGNLVAEVVAADAAGSSLHSPDRERRRGRETNAASKGRLHSRV